MRRKGNSNLPSLNPLPDDIKVQARYQSWDEIEEGASRNNAYINPSMDFVGLVIRKAYHWMESTNKCYLVMDNTGGHISNTTNEQYINLLQEKYNIHINF